MSAKLWALICWRVKPKYLPEYWSLAPTNTRRGTLKSLAVNERYRTLKNKKPLISYKNQGFIELLKTSLDVKKLIFGGEGGIRTRGKFYPTHAFQACDLNHSSTSPKPTIITRISGLANNGQGS